MPRRTPHASQTYYPSRKSPWKEKASKQVILYLQSPSGPEGAAGPYFVKLSASPAKRAGVMASLDIRKMAFRGDEGMRGASDFMLPCPPRPGAPLILQAIRCEER